MKIKKSSAARRVLAMLVIAMAACTILAACVDVDSSGDLLESGNVSLNESSRNVDSSSEEVTGAEGYTATPVVRQCVNITPDVVALIGECEEGSVITVTGGKEDVTTESRGNYFIIQTELKSKNNLLKVSALVEGKKQSEEREYVAYYNATADTRLDGNSVSVGVNSRLFFDKMLDDASGKNLYTASGVTAIRNFVSDTVNGYNERAKGQEVEIIYALIPDVTTIYPGIFPDGAVEHTNTTIYDQVLKALTETRATVVDMRAVFNALIEQNDETLAAYGGLYRVNDSNLTDYAGYLTYAEIMKTVAKRFPDAAPRALEEFESQKVTSFGGNLISYRGIESGLVYEELTLLKPKFTLNLGTNGAGSSTLTALRKYIDKDNGDYGFFITDNDTDNINGIAERWLIDTARTDVKLPNAMIYRDEGSYTFSDILAERFDKSLLGKSGDFIINLSNSILYRAEDKNVVDYIIVILSESNMENAFSLAFGE